MSSASSLAVPDFAGRVAEAQRQLNDAAARAGLRQDAYHLVVEAQSTVIGLFPDLVARMDATRHPLSEDDVRRLERTLAIGVTDQVGRAVRVMDRRNLLYALLGAAAIAVLGFSAGYWWTTDRMAARVDAAEAKAAAADERVADVYQRAVAANDGFGTKLSVMSAERWLWLIHQNAGNDLHECVPNRPQTAQGQKCTPTLWTQLPIATASK